MSRPRQTERRLWGLLLSVAALSAVWLLATVCLIGATLAPTGRQTVWALLGARWSLLLLLLSWGLGMAAVAWALKRGFDHEVPSGSAWPSPGGTPPWAMRVRPLRSS
jgi:DNA polymerase-3 subunit epsilon